MTQVIMKQLAAHFGGLELNALLYAGVLPATTFGAARVSGAVTPIYDLNGDLLFHRAPIIRGRDVIGYADIAAFGGFSAPLLAVSQGLAWDERSILASAAAAAKKKKPSLRFDASRFVAYSYPKVAVQFLAKGEEVVMLELGSWAPVPPLRRRPIEEPPTNFERWSFIDEFSPQRLRAAEKVFKKRIQKWDNLCPPKRPPRGFDPLRLRPSIFEKAFKPKIAVRVDTKEIRYSPVRTDHTPCFELRGQLTSVWCVAASVQMLLDFYRYNYAQTRIATELNLGTLTNPNGLPYANDNDVVTTVERLTSNALNASMNTSPSWSEFTAEIKANRPLISFVPGHSRAVAGYTSTRIFSWQLFRGLLVYDPWPPTAGVITRWENFDATTYRRTFTAALTLV